jgi:hypothetical protein
VANWCWPLSREQRLREFSALGRGGHQHITEISPQLSKLSRCFRVTAFLITFHTIDRLSESVLLVTKATDKSVQLFGPFQRFTNSLDDHAQLLVASLAQALELPLLGEYILLPSLNSLNYLYGSELALLCALQL